MCIELNKQTCVVNMHIVDCPKDVSRSRVGLVKSLFGSFKF